MSNYKVQHLRNEPKIRFESFTSNYDGVVLSNLLKPKSEKNKNNIILDVLTNSALFGIVTQEEYFDREITTAKNHENYKLIEPGDFVYNPRKSLYAPYGPFNRSNLKGIMSPLYNVFKDTHYCDSTYLEYYLKSSALHKNMYMIANYGARHDRMNFQSTDFLNMKFNIPTESEEQIKIGLFLKKIDNKILLTEEKLQNLKLFNKGIIDEMITKNICKSYLFGDLGKTVNGLTGKTKEDFGSGELFVNYMNVFANRFIDISECEKVNIYPGENQNEILYGDIVFTTSSETPNEVGMSSVFMYEGNMKIYLNSFCFIFRLNSRNYIDPCFAGYYFRSSEFRSKMYKLAQGISRYNLSKGNLLKEKIKVPDIEKQRELSVIFTSMDIKVKLVQQKLETLKQFKKGLLQEMFV